MPKDKKNNLVNRHAKWEQESARIRKVQISLDFSDSTDLLLRTLAAREHKAPSSLIREILGMPVSPPKRARIGVSFNDEELNALGERYDIDPQNRAEIRRKVTEEVSSVVSLTQDNTGSRIDENNMSANTDLENISNDIYQRFQRALSNKTKKE